MKRKTANAASKVVPAGSAAIDRLNPRLADLQNLYGMVKHAHWNVTGPSFIALHLLFDTTADLVSGLGDEVAERIVQLGGLASGRLGDVVAASRLPAYPAGRMTSDDHVAALEARLRQLSSSLQGDIDALTALGDAGSADLLTGGVRMIDKQRWQIGVHLKTS